MLLDFPQGRWGKDATSAVAIGSARLAGGEQEVVEELGGEAGLQQAGVELLQGHVAVEGEAAPAPGDRFGLGAGLDRAQAPAPGVGEQLLAADPAARSCSPT